MNLFPDKIPGPESQDRFNLKFGRILPYIIRTSDRLYRRHQVHSSEVHLSCTPFFIIGSGRNGSTLLSSMLNQHSKIMVPPEQWVLYEVIIKYKLYNLIEWKDLVNICLGLYADIQTNEGWKTNFQHLYSELHNLPKSRRTLTKILDKIYLTHGRQRELQFETWGEKSPLNTVYLRYIYPVFPQSKYVFLIRDGRDVVSSITKVRGRDLKYAAWRWNYSIAQFEWLKSEVSGNQLRIIRYEDLITEPEKTLRKLMSFLGYDYESSMMNYQESVDYLDLEKFDYHQNVKRSLDKQRIGKWKDRLSQEEIDKLMPMLKDNLFAFNYSE